MKTPEILSGQPLNCLPPHASVNWDVVLSQPRSVGGHEEVMRNIFGDPATVISEWSDHDYQGTVAFAYQVPGVGVVVMTDYYGSCSGCDAWEDSSDEDARKMIHDLVQGAKVFATVADAAAWCASVDSVKEPWNYPFEAAKNLVFPTIN